LPARGRGAWMAGVQRKPGRCARPRTRPGITASSGAGHCPLPVMVREGGRSTPCGAYFDTRRVWRAFARHDEMATTAAILTPMGAAFGSLFLQETGSSG
jgi:hypothetical protein